MRRNCKLSQIFTKIILSFRFRVSSSEKNLSENPNKIINSQFHQQHQTDLRLGLGNMDQNNHKSLPCYPDKNRSNYYSPRPIVYQSQNCKNRQEEDTKTFTKNAYISNPEKRSNQLVGKSSFKGNLNFVKKEPNVLVPASQRSQSPNVAEDEHKYANVPKQATPVNQYGK